MYQSSKETTWRDLPHRGIRVIMDISVIRVIRRYHSSLKTTGDDLNVRVIRINRVCRVIHSLAKINKHVNRKQHGVTEC